MDEEGCDAVGDSATRLLGYSATRLLGLEETGAEVLQSAPNGGEFAAETGCVQVAEVPGEQEEVLQLTHRTKGDGDKAGEFPVSAASLTLGDVSGDRNRSPTHLSREAKEFMSRERGRLLVDVEYQRVSRSPNCEALEVWHDGNGPVVRD